MVIADRLRTLRESKNMSQGDVEKKTGLLRCYISRVENGHTVPAIETLEKLCRALEVPMYKLFYDGEKPPTDVSDLPKLEKKGMVFGGEGGKDARYLTKLRRNLTKLGPRDRTLLLVMSAKMARDPNAKTA